MLQDQNWESHIKVVNSIVHDLGVDKPMLYVLNKIDTAVPLNEQQLTMYQPHVSTCAQTKEGIQPLVEQLDLMLI